MDTLKIKVLVGSTREGRFSDKPAAWIADLAKAQEGVEVEVLDLRDYPMPFYEESVSPSMVQDGAYANPAVRTWADKIREADAFIIVTPEYNRGPSAVLKNALDQVYAEWNKKPVAFVGHGSALGARAIEQLRTNAIELQMAPIRQAVGMPWSGMLLAEDGTLKPDAFAPYEKAAVGLIESLLWWGRALKAARTDK